MRRLPIVILAFVFCSGFDQGGCDCDRPPTPQQTTGPCGKACVSGTHCDLDARQCVTDTPNMLPDTAIENFPPALTASADTQFRFVASTPDATFECSVDASAFVACFTPYVAHVGEGVHTFAVRAVRSGAADPTPATYTWRVDTTPPDTQITSGPTDSGNTGMLIAFTSNESPVRFKCQLDAEVAYECNDSASRTELTVGQHTFTVYAIDQLGNRDPTPAQIVWNVLAPTPTVCGPLFFSKHWAQLGADMLPCLDQLVLSLNQSPQTTALIDGHRDPTEAAAVSQQRAQNALDYVVSKGIDPARVTARDVGIACLHASFEPSYNPRVTLFSLANGQSVSSVVEACAPW